MKLLNLFFPWHIAHQLRTCTDGRNSYYFADNARAAYRWHWRMAFGIAFLICIWRKPKPR